MKADIKTIEELMKVLHEQKLTENIKEHLIVELYSK